MYYSFDWLWVGDGESIDDNRLPTDKGQHKSDGRHIYIVSVCSCVFVCVVYA